MPCRLQQRLSIQNVPSCALHLVALTVQWVLLTLLSTISFSKSFREHSSNLRNNDDSSTVRISLPFKDQVAANAVRKQLRDLSHKIGPTLQPVFVSKKLGQDLKPKEIKPSVVNRQCCLPFFTWSVRCRLCRLHSPTPSSTHCWAQKFGNR